MVFDEPVVLVSLVLTSAVGVGFAFFAYELSDSLLSWIGWVGGGAIGGTIGWVVVPEALGPEAATGEILGAAAVLIVVGAFLGRILINVVGRFAAMFAGFITTFFSVLMITTGEELINDLLSVLLGAETTDPAMATSEAAASPAIEEQHVQQALLIAVGAGVVGAIVAWKYYTVIITGAITAGGAGLLGIVVPAWQRFLSGDPELADGFTQVSTTWFAVVFLAGVVFQAARHTTLLDRFDPR